MFIVHSRTFDTRHVPNITFLDVLLLFIICTEFDSSSDFLIPPCFQTSTVHSIMAHGYD